MKTTKALIPIFAAFSLLTSCKDNDSSSSETAPTTASFTTETTTMKTEVDISKDSEPESSPYISYADKNYSYQSNTDSTLENSSKVHKVSDSDETEISTTQSKNADKTVSPSTQQTTDAKGSKIDSSSFNADENELPPVSLF